ncbi:MAG: hypothetical protein LBS54_03330 [Dysgonamonadaceae bacterium]|jgi:hypothetical protein|nr:hypothetical protein [Dysgonamonadaceae bacterium]
MYSHDYLPQSFDGLSNWLINFIDYLAVNRERFGISSDDFDRIRLKAAEYNMAHRKAEDKNASSPDKQLRHDLAIEVRADVRDFVNEHLRFNKAVTRDDKRKLGLTVPSSSRTPVKVPDTFPEASIKLPAEGVVVVKFRDSKTKLRAKPAGVQGAEIKWILLDKKAEIKEELIYSNFDTSSPYKFSFEDHDRYKVLSFILRWENNRGAKGPWSPIYYAVVP